MHGTLQYQVIQNIQDSTAQKPSHLFARPSTSAVIKSDTERRRAADDTYNSQCRLVGPVLGQPMWLQQPRVRR